ncbi:MAG: ABC transporter permease [Pigmentiphaga sp.]|nr:ABC transporter permease [Pigmentiphaga sp.]
MNAPGRPKRESSLGEEVAKRLEGSPSGAPGRPKRESSPGEEVAKRLEGSPSGAPGRPKRESSPGEEVAKRLEGSPSGAPGRPKRESSPGEEVAKRLEGGSISALWRIALASLWSRRFTVGLTVLTILLSVTLFLGVDRIREEARTAFLRSASGVDLVVGARAHPVQLLLYTVFGLGEATQNVSWDAYQVAGTQPGVAWTVPISLGDSHQGFRVIGTTDAFFEHVQVAGAPITLAEGTAFDHVYDAVLGADVARRLGYAVGESIVLAHGTARRNPQQHDDQPFVVRGVLAPTGSPIDQAVYVSLEGIEAIHLNWRGGTRVGKIPALDTLPPEALQPRSITAFYVGLESRLGVFAFQRWIQQYRGEPLSAILPGVALQQLWSLLGTAETALDVTTSAVVLTGLIGLLAVLLATLDERRREMAVLRAVGAGPRHIFTLLLAEALWLGVLGTLLGYALLQGLCLAVAPWLQAHYGLILQPGWPGGGEWARMGLVVAATGVVGLLPALLAYRHSVADGVKIRY